jgi:hypothetical protein
MSIIPRFYETNIKIGFTSTGYATTSQNMFNLMIDPIPAPSPATRAPATACPPPPAPRSCPPAPACRVCPTINKIKVISASIDANNRQQLIVESPGGLFTTRESYVSNNPNISELSRVRGGDIKGGQVTTSDYIFRPEMFNLNTDYRTSTDNLPVYFDYYTFFTLGNTNIINRTTVNSVAFRNANFTNSLFILDKNNIPHYISGVAAGGAIQYYSINKKINNSYMNFFDPIKIDYEKRLIVDIKLNNRINTNITISDITLMPIPTSLPVPNIRYAKTSPSLVTPTILPIVEQPAPRPAPSPAPTPATVV